MEPAGLAIDVLAIAGLLNKAIDCFKYVQIGRDFGQAYRTGLLKVLVVLAQHFLLCLNSFRNTSSAFWYFCCR